MKKESKLIIAVLIMVPVAIYSISKLGLNKYAVDYGVLCWYDYFIIYGGSLLSLLVMMIKEPREITKYHNFDREEYDKLRHYEWVTSSWFSQKYLAWFISQKSERKYRRLLNHRKRNQ